MSDMEHKPDDTSKSDTDAPKVHCDNKQVLVRLAEGVEFKIAITHTEKEGEHQVVVASADFDLPLLRICAEPIIKMMAKHFGVSLDHLTYFERDLDGKVFEVNTNKIAQDRAPRGRWANGAQVLERQRPVEMPNASRDADLTPESPSQALNSQEQEQANFRRARFQRYKL